jgi:hypothetical protein
VRIDGNVDIRTPELQGDFLGVFLRERYDRGGTLGRCHRLEANPWHFFLKLAQERLPVCLNVFDTQLLNVV